MTPLGRYVLETVVTLCAVAGLAVAVLYLARRSGIGRPTGPLELAGRLVLDARRAVYLIRVGGTVYVVGASEAGLSKLGEFPSEVLGDAVPASAQPSGSAGFSQVLARVIRRGASPPAPEPRDRRKLGSEGP